MLIDDHGSRVPPAVWSLYSHTIRKIGPRPTLIEWDTEVPSLDVLLGEAMWADMLVQAICFERRMLPASLAPQTSRSEGLILPLQPARAKGGPMPALAALAAITPSVFANHSSAGRTGRDY